MTNFGTQAIAELTPQQAAIEGRRTVDSKIIYIGGTPGPRGATSSVSFRIKGTVATTGDLPDGTAGEPRAEGDAYVVQADGNVYVFNSTANAWQDIGALTIGVQSSDGSVGNMRAMTQSEYDALPVKDPLTFYIIKISP